MASLKPLGAGDPRDVGPYRLIARLGAGGMGRVYLGRSRGGRAVAVKVVRPELAEDGEFRLRFAREVVAARRVNGVFTAGVVDADTDADPPWLATAYVPGLSLDMAVAGSGAWPEGPVASLAAGLAEALEAIHAVGLVHRDLKPSNVLLAADGPRVIDFGISAASEVSAITRTGAVIGTPGFMSPEQLTGRHIGPESDVFALGAVLAFAASGTGPFGTGSAQGLMFRIVYSEPDLDAVPPGLRPLVARCLAKEPGDRPSLGEVLAEVTESAGAAEPTLLFTSASWLPESIARTVREHARTVAEAAGPASVGPDGRSPLADAATRTAPGGVASAPPWVPPTPPPAVPPTSAPTGPPVPPPSVPPSPPPAGPGTTPPPAGGTPDPSVAPPLVPGSAPTALPDGGPRPDPGGGTVHGCHPHRSQRLALAASAAAVALVAIFVWQAGAIFGSGGSGAGSAGSAASAPGAAETDGLEPPPQEASTADAAAGLPSGGSSEPSPVERDSPASDPEPSDSSGVRQVTGRWLGSYVCNQGITGLSLNVEDEGGGDVSAVFSFFPAPSNPLVPRGSFAMSGTYRNGRLVLDATHWIVRPPDYLMVNLLARYDPDTPDHLDGTVYGAGCSSFSVARS
ncbi:serine/threonine-protein kinase [Streptomyces sp. NPDC059176]